MRVKKLVNLDAQQNKRVKQLAREAKTSESEVAADTERVMKHIREKSGGWVDDPAEFFHG